MNDNSGSQGGSGAGTQQQENRNSSIRPVTIRQIFSSTVTKPDEDTLMLDYKPLKHVRFIGVIRGISDHMATGRRYRIEDGTGIIEARTFNRINDNAGLENEADEHGDGKTGDNDQDMDQDNSRHKNPENEVKLDMYVTVFARVTFLQDRHSVTIVAMQPITDFNEIAYHLLNTIHSHVTHTGQLIRGGAAGATAGADSGAHGNSLFMSTDSASSHSGLQDKIVTYLRKFMAQDSGVHCQQIANELGVDFNSTKAALDHLNSDGFLYMPEDDHYAITPS